MKTLKIEIPVIVYDFDDLSEADKKLVEEAKKATYQSYSPYSHFRVGAAVLMANGEIVTGSNQENAAYPSGLCAERTALFYANSTYPETAVKTICIAARNEIGLFTNQPVSPCGACRQVMAEVETRSKCPLRVLLFGNDGIYEFKGVESLLPFSFKSESMNV